MTTVGLFSNWCGCYWQEFVETFWKLLYFCFCVSSDRYRNTGLLRFYQQFETHFHMRTIWIIIPTNFVTNALCRLCFKGMPNSVALMIEFSFIVSLRDYVTKTVSESCVSCSMYWIGPTKYLLFYVFQNGANGSFFVQWFRGIQWNIIAISRNFMSVIFTLQ